MLLKNLNLSTRGWKARENLPQHVKIKSEANTQRIHPQPTSIECCVAMLPAPAARNKTENNSNRFVSDPRAIWIRENRLPPTHR